MFLGPLPAECGLDDEAAGDRDGLVKELLQNTVPPPTQGRVPGWRPPPAEQLAAWLGQGGHEVAIDREGNLRLTLRRPGCDAAVRVDREEGRLRLALPLGPRQRSGDDWGVDTPRSP